MIGFSAVTGCSRGRVDAVPVFWNAEGVALRERGLDISEFRVEDYGAPPYPEVVLITSPATLAARRDAPRAHARGDHRRRADASPPPAPAVAQIAAAAATDDPG